VAAMASKAAEVIDMRITAEIKTGSGARYRPSPMLETEDQGKARES
jgi:hypothetical protein